MENDTNRRGKAKGFFFTTILVGERTFTRSSCYHICLLEGGAATLSQLVRVGAVDG